MDDQIDGSDPPARSASQDAWRVGLLLAVVYLSQGLGKPDAGLIAQPIRSLLSDWGRDAAEIATFSALLATPWSFKPLFGLIADSLPLGRSSRRNYLLILSGIAAVGLLGLAIDPVAEGSTGQLAARLILPALALPFADVVADAILVERGQALGQTGRFQAVQWACLGLAEVVAGVGGGRLSEGDREPWAFGISGVGAALTCCLVWAFLRLPTRTAPAGGPRPAFAAIGRASRDRRLLGAIGFLFLWNFNPFSYDVLYVHLTRELGWGERTFGAFVSWVSAAEIATCVGYGVLCRRFTIRTLIRASVVLGVLSTLAYLALVDRRLAVPVALAVGLAYMTATLILMDLAARVCPPEAAGTTFATLMAVQNLSTTLSIYLGGGWYERIASTWGYPAAFRTLVVVGSAFTACCWLVLPDVSEGGPAPGSAARPASLD